MPRILVGVRRILDTDHLLVQFLTRTYPDYLLRAPRIHRLRDVADVHRWDLFHVDLAADHIVERVPHKLNTLLKRNHEARHPRIGNREDARLCRLEEERNHTPARAHHVSVADDRKAGVLRARIGVAGNEHLVGDELRRSVEVHRRTRLVCRKRHKLLHAPINAGIHKVHRPMHVRLDALKGIILRRRHNLRCRCVDDEVNTVQRAIEPFLVAHVPDEESHARIVLEELRHIPLLHLVPAVDDELLRIVPYERHRHEGVSKRTGTAGQQYR